MALTPTQEDALDAVLKDFQGTLHRFLPKYALDAATFDDFIVIAEASERLALTIRQLAASVKSKP